MAHHDVAIEIHHERSAGLARTLDEFLRVLERVQIRAANSARERFDQRFAGPRLRGWNVIDDEFSTSHYGSAHS